MRNHYGMMAQEHWKRWLPQRYQEIKDPESFFDDLGEEIARQVEELSRNLAGNDPGGESYLQKLGRLTMAHANAESQVLRELALLEPEPGAEEEPLTE